MIKAAAAQSIASFRTYMNQRVSETDSLPAVRTQCAVCCTNEPLANGMSYLLTEEIAVRRCLHSSYGSGRFRLNKGLLNNSGSRNCNWQSLTKLSKATPGYWYRNEPVASVTIIGCAYVRSLCQTAVSEQQFKFHESTRLRVF